MNIFLILCGFLSLTSCNESKFKSCIKHPDFQNLIIRGLTGKFTDVRFWNENSAPREHLVKIIVEQANETDGTLFREVFHAQNNHKLYKTKHLPAMLLHHPDITSGLTSTLLSGGGGETGPSELESFISRSSDIFWVWFISSLKSLESWLRENFHLLSNDISEIGATEIARIIRCLTKYSDEDFEDKLTWFSCFYVCRDLRNISKDIEGVFKTIPQCSGSEWLGDLIIRIFMDFVHLNDCYFEVISPKKTLLLVEGDLNKLAVKFQTFVTPGVHCFPSNAFQHKKKVVKEIIKYVFGLRSYCRVKLEFSTSNYLRDFMPPPIGTPKCRDGSGIVQVAMEFHPDGINNKSADILLTTDNWNKTFVIPLIAVVDHKLERMRETDLNFTIKMLVDDKRINSTKFPLKVVDKESRNVGVCQSINDPHLVTFDNLYYNNLEQGYFILYKNKELPYEVQVIYQSCGPTTRESCNCAVAVKSYDDVFVVDKCRLRTNGSSDNSESLRVMKVTLFVNGRLNRATRIFRKHGGMAYQILLPHGTLINIRTNAFNFLNVWISPSPFDRNRTSGLCGTFNDITGDDLLHSDGNYSEVTKVRKYPPHNFIRSWRVKPQDRIFEGVEATNEDLNETCRCSHQALKNISCKCGFHQFVESCHLDLGDEFLSTNISLIARKSKRNFHENDSRDVDESFQSELNFTGNNFPLRKYCTSLLIRNSKLIKLCSGSFLFKNSSRGPVGNAVEGCMDDMKITGNPQELSFEWKLSALDAAKETCLMVLSRNPFFFGRMENIFENETCVNECFMRGTCISKSCQCNVGYSGADCSIEDVSDYKPTIFTAVTTFCDSRTENCSYVEFFGKNFTEEIMIMCNARPIKATSIDKVELTKSAKVQAYILSSNQAICVLPGTSRQHANSQEISISLETQDNLQRQVTLSKFKFVVYDSACMTCNPATCSLEKNVKYCLVGNICYEDFEQHEEDPCLICNVSSSTNELTHSQKMECVMEREKKTNLELRERKDLIIRLIVSVSFSILVVIATLAIFIQENKASHKSVSEDDEAISDDKSPEFKVSAVNNRQTSDVNDECHEMSNEKLFNSIKSLKTFPKTNESNRKKSTKEDEKSRSMSANFGPHFHREKRQRTFSETSEKSYGIGGGGPILFGCHSRLSCILPQITNENCCIRGHSANLFASVASTPRGSRVETNK